VSKRQRRCAFELDGSAAWLADLACRRATGRHFLHLLVNDEDGEQSWEHGVMGLRLLVVEGNVREVRERHQAGFGRTYSQSYAEVLRSLADDAQCDLCFPADAGANLPDSGGLSGYDGVAITGSALNIYDGGPAVARQLELTHAIFSAGIPFFGSCWGLQLASVASGGRVSKNPLGREIGIARNIAKTAFGLEHPLLAGRPLAFDAPCIHLDIVAMPPPNAWVLASNEFAAVQAVEIRRDDRRAFWGVQYHPEFSLTELSAILDRYQPTLIKEGIFADVPAANAHCADLRALDRNPRDRTIAWRLGIQPEILDPGRRLTEIRNWLDKWVRPEKSRRQRA
jgi:GMP synthase (glutamine-hydrolysing)